MTSDMRMRNILLFNMLCLGIMGVGCSNDTTKPSTATTPLLQQTSSYNFGLSLPTSPSTEYSDEKYAERAANALRYMMDKNFVAFIKTIQPTDCKGEIPNVSYIIEADLLGDGRKELVVDATSCRAYSSGADMNFVARVNKNNQYSILKINGEKMIGYYAGLEVQNGILVKEQAVFNPEDANAGPSGGVDLTYFRWDGKQFITAKKEHVSTWLQPQY